MKVSHPRRAWSAATAFVCSLGLALTARADGDLRTVALSGDQVPGADTGVVFSSFPNLPVLNVVGQTAFRCKVVGPGVDWTNDEGIYSEGSGALAVVAREGYQAPGADPGVVFIDLDNPALNNAGQTAFLGFPSGPNGIGIYSDGASTLAEVAGWGTQAPGADLGVVFHVLYAPVLSAAGQTAFRVGLTGPGVNATNDHGIYIEAADSLAEVARTGNQAPGADPGVVFRDFGYGDPVVNPAGQSAFSSVLTGPGVDSTNNFGIYREGGGTLAEVARGGTQAPGADLGVFFRGFFSSPKLNAAGQIAFIGDLTGVGVTLRNDRGIYSDRDGSLAEVVREGDQAPGADPGVEFIYFGPPVLNAAGQTAFYGKLSGTGVVRSVNDRGIYSEGSGTMAEVARSGNQVPDADPGVVFRFLNPPALNAAGQIAFHGILTGPGVDFSNDDGIYATDRNGLLVEIVREGSLIDVNDDPLIDDLRIIRHLEVISETGYEGGGRSGFNDLGQLAFSASFTDGTSGIFVSNRVAIPEPATATLLALCLPALLRRRNC